MSTGTLILLALGAWVFYRYKVAPTRTTAALQALAPSGVVAPNLTGSGGVMVPYDIAAAKAAAATGTTGAPISMGTVTPLNPNRTLVNYDTAFERAMWTGTTGVPESMGTVMVPSVGVTPVGFLPPPAWSPQAYVPPSLFEDDPIRPILSIDTVVRQVPVRTRLAL